MPFSKIGRICFALPIAGFATQHLLCAFSLGPPPSPPWVHGPAAVILLEGVLLLFGSAFLFIERYARWAATLLAILGNAAVESTGTSSSNVTSLTLASFTGHRRRDRTQLFCCRGVLSRIATGLYQLLTMRAPRPKVRFAKKFR